MRGHALPLGVATAAGLVPAAVVWHPCLPGPGAHAQSRAGGSSVNATGLSATGVSGSGAAAARSSSPTPTPKGAPIHKVVTLGDSVAEGAATGGRSFGDIVAADLSRPGAPVTSANLAVSGLTTPDLIEQVRTDADTRKALDDADVVLITIGANDVVETFTETSDRDCDDACIASKAEAVGADVRTALTAIDETTHRSGVRVYLTNYWNVSVDGAVAREEESSSFNAWTDRLTRRVNAELAEAAHERGAGTVDTYAAFKADGSVDPTRLLAEDGEHPDEQGQRVIAKAVEAELQR